MILNSIIRNSLRVSDGYFGDIHLKMRLTEDDKRYVDTIFEKMGYPPNTCIVHIDEEQHFMVIRMERGENPEYALINGICPEIYAISGQGYEIQEEQWKPEVTELVNTRLYKQALPYVDLNALAPLFNSPA